MNASETPCCKCGKNLGLPVAGLPIQANRTVYFEHGEALVRWTGIGPKLFGHLCDDCAAQARYDEENDPNYGLTY